MESAEHLARALALKQRGVQVLLWESKTDLIFALLVLQAVLPDFPDSPILLPSGQADLERFSIGLYEESEQPAPTGPRFLLVPQAITESLGGWLNGWRRRLSDPPGTILVIRRADYAALCRRAPDLASFTHSDVHEATGLLPLLDTETSGRISNRLPGSWYEILNMLPGEMAQDEDIANWTTQIRQLAG